MTRWVFFNSINEVYSDGNGGIYKSERALVFSSEFCRSLDNIMSPVVGFYVSLNYNFYESGEFFPIEGCFVNQFTNEATLVTFDNSFRKQTKRDVLCNVSKNRNLTGLETQFNGTTTVNFFRGLLMRAYIDLKKELVLMESDVLYVACGSYLDEALLQVSLHF